MRNILKATTVENKLPLLAVENGCIVSMIQTGKKGFLSEFCFEGFCISSVLCVDIQHVLPCSHDPRNIMQNCCLATR